MERFSYGDALGAGFRVIARKPLALLLWAATYLLLVGLPAFAIVSSMLPILTAAVREAAQFAGPPDPARMLGLQSRMFGWQPAIWLLQVVANTILMGAVFRAVLQPQDGRWGYLRLSRQELWLGLTYLVLIVMTIIMAMVLFIPLAIGIGVVAALAEHSGAPQVGGGLALCLAALAGAGVIVWVWLRLSLALPMSFAQARFMLYESWDLTRGQAIKMFMVFVALVGGLLLIELALFLTVGLGVLPQLRHGPVLASALRDASAGLVRLWAPTILGLMVVLSVVGTAIRVLFVAPLAEIYRELSGETAPAA